MCQIDKMHIHRRCKTPDEPSIVYIVWKNEQLGICKLCWEKFPVDLEWGDSPKPTMEDIFSDKSRLGDNPVETEYKLKGKKLEEQPTEEEDF